MGLLDTLKSAATAVAATATKVVQAATAAVQSAASTAAKAVTTVAAVVAPVIAKVAAATTAATNVVNAAKAVAAAAAPVAAAKISDAVTTAASNIVSSVTKYVSSPSVTPPPGQVSILPVPPIPVSTPTTPTLSAAEQVAKDAFSFLDSFEYTFTAIKAADPVSRELMVEDAFRKTLSAAAILSSDVNLLEKSVVLDEKASAYQSLLPEKQLLDLITKETAMRADMPFLYNIVACMRQVGDPASAWKIVQTISGAAPAARAFADLCNTYGESIPDVIKKVVSGVYSFFGLDSWAKVVSGYSFLEMRPAEPTAKDFAIVAIDLAAMAAFKMLDIGAKLGLAKSVKVSEAATAHLSAKAAGEVSENVIKGAAASSADDIAEIGARAYAKGASSISIEIEPGIRAMIQTAPLAGIPLWKRLLAELTVHPLLTILGASLLLTRLDVVGWGFGLLPEELRRETTSLVGSIRSNLITMDDLQRAGRTAEAASLYADTKPMVERLDDLFLSYPIRFWETLGTDFGTAKLLAEGVQAAYAEYGATLPGFFPPAWPEKTHGTVTYVYDGDSIFINNMTGNVNEIRIVGIDAHEAGTESGRAETAFLRSMLLGNEVDVMVDSKYAPRDIYGRVLGTVYFPRHPDGKNVSVEMLKQFGESLLTPTKYQDRNQFVDWDLLKAAAKRPVIPTSTLKITSKPSNARVILDGNFTGQLTPATIPGVMEGRHAARVELPGYQPSEAVFMTPATLELHFELIEIPAPPTTGTVSVSTSPPYSMYVYVDGLYTGKSTPAVLKLPPGGYEITFAKTGVEAAPQSLRVEAGREYAVVAAASEIAPEPEEVDTATLSISSTPTGAAIYLNGLYTAHKTPYVFNVTPGEYLLELRKDGYETWKGTFLAAAGDEIPINADLIKLKEPELPIILIVTTPAAADITIDTLPTRKKTPWYFSINPGLHLVRVEKDGYYPQERGIEVVEVP